ncbi:MAG: copper resistance protein NlpE N-terminal domain-containing protein [Bacteroidetes bacterium]|nr:copper resistance protein NlpE N-terminal domain-containing protein [Bacteroidota bacterium]
MKPTNFLCSMIISGMIALVSCNSPANRNNVQNPDPAHNSRISLDWPGTYLGVLPCADCEGIATTIHLNPDETYELEMTYLGKESNNFYAFNGEFAWDEDGNIITLSDFDGGAPHFRVGENKLFQLDIDKKPIEGELSEMYVLNKKQLSAEEAQLHDIYWKLVEVGGRRVDSSTESMKKPYLKFDLFKMRAYGTGGCNNFFGRVELPSSGLIRFNRMASTMMACPDMQIDQLLFEAFEKAEAYSINDGKLSLSGQGRVLAVFEMSE